MKKVCIIVYVFSLTFNVVFGQVSYPLDSLNFSNVKYLMIIDSLKVEVFRNGVNKSFIFINDNPIDSTGITSESIPVLYKNNLFFNNTSRDFSKKIMYTQNKINKYQSIFTTDNGFMQYYDYSDLTNIYIVDPLSGSKKLYTNYDETMSDCAISGFFIDTSLACVIHCCNGIEACDYTKYYLVSPNETKEVTQQIRQSLKEEDAMLTSLFFNFVSSDKRYLHLGVQYMSEKYAVKRETVSRIFNNDFEEIGKILDIKYPDICGMNIQKEKLQHYFLSSITDTKDSTKRIMGMYSSKRVIIPYKFNPYLEMAMYKAYNNNLLTNENIKSLEKYELGILRNLIFAKYNYAFSSEFYQAYFNLYEFYGNEKAQKSRVTDVNNKLTETDKANIKLIKEIEVRL